MINNYFLHFFNKAKYTTLENISNKKMIEIALLSFLNYNDNVFLQNGWTIS